MTVKNNKIAIKKFEYNFLKNLGNNQVFVLIVLCCCFALNLIHHKYTYLNNDMMNTGIDCMDKCMLILVILYLYCGRDKDGKLIIASVQLEIHHYSIEKKEEITHT
jgi:hypothetical protein